MILRRALRPLLTGIALAVAGPLFAQSDPIQSARDAMAQLKVATQAMQDAQKSGDRISALTQTVQAYEKGLSALRDGLRRINLREAALEAQFKAERDRLGQLLGVLQAIGKSPAPALLVHPSGPVGTARSGMILSEVTPALQAQAEDLRSRLDEQRILRALQENAVKTLQTGLADVQEARFELSLALARRTELPRRFVADEVRMATLLESADTLSSFADGLMSDPDAAASATGLPDFASVRGRLAMPVLGRVLRGYGERDAAGIQRPGLIVATRPLSIVATPWPATIRYLGPLLDYGNVAILEPGDGYLIVLAGLGQLYGGVGEVLAQGAPVGLMGGADFADAADDDQAFLIAAEEGTGAERTETLYIELRHDGTPVDPTNWFAAGKE